MSAAGSVTLRAGASLVIVGTFALGMIAGAAILHIARLGLGPPPPPPGGPVAHLERELGLSPEQRERVRDILEQSRERMRDEGESTRERIRALLTPEQRERFEALRPPPPPPPLGPPRGRRGPPPPGAPRD